MEENDNGSIVALIFTTAADDFEVRANLPKTVTKCHCNKSRASFWSLLSSYRGVGCQIVGCKVAATDHPLIEHEILIGLLLLLGLISARKRGRVERREGKNRMVKKEAKFN